MTTGMLIIILNTTMLLTNALVTSIQSSIIMKATQRDAKS
ncbi:hypothetical protein Goe27_01830 [Bacillus phage vB_BsuM-Goe27]|uniref:Uncharacterized protein n=1 Tax=Bacillus phage vB_BsuM-Goe3 TaxID=1933063 RepID=A0A217ERB1_BPGO3|nr:hypothetical protein HWB07_gp132 [Bacillus phage vB_BsuM-Goe3]AYJ76047.1 hypothetical protein BSP14_172 [Bacillus phage BSP14]AYJ76374.1 FtsK/SpoIIIE protein [Bacillus phage BSP12]QDP43205.1 putative membrane-bound protein [Bacillus phage vB_BveM-Goe7]UJJ74731.1 hypothetical protein [Bacillus phage BM-P1]WCS69044.1 hypothetical protein Goe17_01850 [Bacillus phage vB_BsuM-Goe17]WCS69299.1 hypothetical protein Goe20_01820 [Bacillus phage vB_BsuM-Goe20]WCS69553.1 hypothetical protein Goe24_0